MTYEGKEYTFGQLMKIVHIEGCAQAMHSFALKYIASAGLNIASSLLKYGDAAGLREWEDASSQHNTHSQTSSAGNALLYLSLNGTTNDAVQYVEKRSAAGTAIRLVTVAPTDEPDMIAVLASLRPMNRIGDLLWADFTTNDRSFNTSAGGFLSEGAVNIYHEPIK